jgi:chromosome segregation ATPase
MEKSVTQSSLKSVEKDIQEIEEKLKKDEGRKAKIQEELDNLARQRDNAMGEVNKFHEDQDKLNHAIKEKETEIETANADLQELRNQA